MKSFLKGLLVGGSITGAALMGYAYGTSADQGASANPEFAPLCNVQVGRPHISADYLCRDNEVMVGHLRDNLYCADIDVRCI